MMSEPTPVADAIYRHDQLYVFLGVSVLSILTVFVAGYFGIVWLEAGALVSSFMFGGWAFLGLLWRRFKRWRYPTYYDCGDEI